MISSRSALTAIILMPLICLAACAHSGEEEEQGPTAVAVRTVVVTPGTFTETVGAIGTIQARAGHSASLSAPAAARISQLTAAVGQRVSPGTTLIVFEQAPFREAARSAEAKLSAAQHAYDRARSLNSEGILPRKDVEQAAAELASARADAVAARRSAQLSVLRSPISGVVTRVNASLGASVDTSQPLVDIADPSAIEAVLGLSPEEAAKVRVGNTVDLRAGQSASGEQLGTGRVIDIGAMVDSATRNVSARVSIPAAKRVLRIGETIYGEIAISERATVISIPSEALVPEGDGFRVFVVDVKNVAHARAVTVGVREPTRVEIRSGLAAGERVVTYGAYGLDDGSTVVLAKQ
jgi:cobalt-zinc-cadmium efflux system membrane fusion protein